MIKKNCLYNIIQGQYPTEKAVKLANDFNRITFIVHKNANKFEIKAAIEKIFKVKVLAVNTIYVKGQNVNFKKTTGKKSDFKKALVTLRKGYDINLADFE